MAVPGEALRCPKCGAALLRPPPAPNLQWIACPHCSASVAVAPASELPPRYTWEVYPGLYPPQPPLRRPAFRWRRVVVPLLVAAAVLSLALMVLTAGYAWQGVQPATYTVDGSVTTSSGSPISDAKIVFIDEVETTTVYTNLSGGFRFTGVPTGGVNMTVTASGYIGVRVLTYVSPSYNAGSTGLGISLAAGSSSNLTVVALSPYPDLEYFAAYVGSTAAIVGIAAIVMLGSAIAVRRADRPGFAVAGGMTAALLPLAFFVTSAGVAFPQLFLLGGVIGGIGAVGAGLGWVELLQLRDRDAPPPPGPV